jgi:hypothetical protein
MLGKTDMISVANLVLPGALTGRMVLLAPTRPAKKRPC